MREPNVGSVMTTQVVTASPETLFRDLVETLTEKRISAVPVVDSAGRPVGVVSRRDLLRVYRYPDDALRAQVEALLAEISVPPDAIQVRVDAGVATVDGELDRRSRVDAAVRAVQALPGVVGVHNDLRYLVDDVVVVGSSGWTGFSP